MGNMPTRSQIVCPKEAKKEIGAKKREKIRRPERARNQGTLEEMHASNQGKEEEGLPEGIGRLTGTRAAPTGGETLQKDGPAHNNLENEAAVQRGRPHIKRGCREASSLAASEKRGRRSGVRSRVKLY